MRIVWLSDTHLNFLKQRNKMTFIKNILLSKPDIVVITGDVSDSPNIIDDLSLFEENLKIPFYFNLGNHDYYFGSIEKVRNKVIEFSNNSQYGKWFNYNNDIIELTDEICLIGSDGWADGRYGNYNKSNVVINDFEYIEDFENMDRIEILSKIQQIADIDFLKMSIKISEAVKHYKKIIICTHVPPFIESCWYEGSYSNEYYLPYFSSKIMGDLIKLNAEENSDVEFLVLCGHTHSSGISRIMSNLIVLTGDSRYYYPDVQKIIDIDGNNVIVKNLNSVLYDLDDKDYELRL